MKIRDIILEVGYGANAAGGTLPSNPGGAAQTPSKEQPTGPYQPGDNDVTPVEYKKTKGINNSVLPTRKSEASKMPDLINGFVAQPGGFSPVNGINTAGKLMHKNKKEINHVDTEQMSGEHEIGPSEEDVSMMRKAAKGNVIRR